MIDEAKIPAIPDQLKNCVSIKVVPDGLKMIYAKSSQARICYWIIFAFTPFIGYIATINLGLVNGGGLILTMTLIALISLISYEWVFKCSIVFTNKQLIFTNLTFYPRVTKLRRFRQNWLESQGYVKVVRSNQRVHYAPMVYLKTKYSLVEIHHKDSVRAAVHNELILACIELTKLSPSSSE